MPAPKKKHADTTFSAEKLEQLVIGQTTSLRLLVWRLRQYLRRRTSSKNDLLNVEASSRSSGKVLRQVYRRLDTLMARFFPRLVKSTPKEVAVQWLEDMIEELGYEIVDADKHKPWGAYFRMANSDVERFIHEFFPGLSLEDAKLGHSDVSLSPKFLLVSPGERLSWQFHHRRAERWRFLTEGMYYLSDTDTQGNKLHAPAGTIVQFLQGERHRLCSADKSTYTLVAEIWQHTDPRRPSTEKDIIRLADDYRRDVR